MKSIRELITMTHLFMNSTVKILCGRIYHITSDVEMFKIIRDTPSEEFLERCKDITEDEMTASALISLNAICVEENRGILEKFDIYNVVLQNKEIEDEAMIATKLSLVREVVISDFNKLINSLERELAGEQPQEEV